MASSWRFWTRYVEENNGAGYDTEDDCDVAEDRGSVADRDTAERIRGIFGDWTLD